MVKNLNALISGATIGDLAGLEELIGMLVASKDIDKNCFQVIYIILSTLKNVPVEIFKFLPYF